MLFLIVVISYSLKDINLKVHLLMFHLVVLRSLWRDVDIFCNV
jgi:hypothetical protein